MRSKIKIIFLSLIVLTLGLSFPIAVIAETIYLKSGKTIEGKIVEETSEYIKIDLYGTAISYFRDEIERIEKQPEDKTRYSNEETVYAPSTYVSKKYGFSIENPAGWKKQENITTPFGMQALLFYTKGEELYPAIGVTQDSMLPFPDVRTVMDFTKKMLGQLKKLGVIVHEEPSYTNLAGTEAARMMFSYPSKYKGEAVRVLWYQVLRDNFVLTFSLTDVESRFDESKVVFEKMLDSFKFIQGGSIVPAAQEEALFKAATRGERQKVIQLLEEGIDVNARDEKEGVTALMLAAIAGHSDIVEFLLSKGADKNAQDRNGLTALMYAVSMNRKKVVELLLNSGVDVAVKDNSGYTALMLAEELSKDIDPEIIQLLKKY